jgi:CTP synthase (UTP-ammonia lyase)
MENKTTIGIIGDYDENKISHPAINEAIEHAAEYLDLSIKYNYIMLLLIY